MTDYRLKPGAESFDVVDGPLAGRRYRKSETYTEIPPSEKHRFEPVKPAKTEKPATEK